MPDSRPTRDQERAQAAFQRVQQSAGTRHATEYKTQCLQLPALIHQCGLCQALAFLESKGAGAEGKKQHQQLLEDLAIVTRLADTREKLTAKARAADVREYQRMTMEAMYCAEWLKRYAEALLKDQTNAEATLGWQ